MYDDFLSCGYITVVCEIYVMQLYKDSGVLSVEPKKFSVPFTDMSFEFPNFASASENLRW